MTMMQCRSGIGHNIETELCDIVLNKWKPLAQKCLPCGRRFFFVFAKLDTIKISGYNFSIPMY